MFTPVAPVLKCSSPVSSLVPKGKPESDFRWGIHRVGTKHCRSKLGQKLPSTLLTTSPGGCWKLGVGVEVVSGELARKVRGGGVSLDGTIENSNCQVPVSAGEIIVHRQNLATWTSAPFPY